MCVKMLLPEMMSYAASCMTLLHQAGIRQTKPFAAVCTSISQQDALVERCKVFSDNRRYGIKSFMNCRKEIMIKCKDDVLFLQYSQEVNGNFLPQLCDILGEGYFENDPIHSLVCVLFNGFIPDEITEYFSVIIPNKEVAEFIEVQNQPLNIQQMIINQRELETNTYLVLWQALSQKKHISYVSERLKEAELLYAAANIRAVLQNIPEQLNCLCDIVKSKIEWSEDLRDKSDLPELFVEKLYEDTEVLYPILSFSEASDKKLDEPCALCTADYYYLPERLMTAIVKKLNQYAGATEIKRALMAAGCLEVQGKNRNYYTQKVKVNNKRLHYYVFWRHCIDRVGEVTLLQIVNLKGDDENGTW